MFRVLYSSGGGRYMGTDGRTNSVWLSLSLCICMYSCINLAPGAAAVCALQCCPINGIVESLKLAFSHWLLSTLVWSRLVHHSRDRAIRFGRRLVSVLLLDQHDEGMENVANRLKRYHKKYLEFALSLCECCAHSPRSVWPRSPGRWRSTSRPDVFPPPTKLRVPAM